MRILLAATERGAWVLDPFTGSSTTGIAANLLGCRFLGIDKEETYLQISKARRKELENPAVFSSYIRKIKDMALLDSFRQMPFSLADENVGYDLSF